MFKNMFKLQKNAQNKEKMSQKYCPDQDSNPGPLAS